MANQCHGHGVLMYRFSYLPRMISLHHKTFVSNMKKFCFQFYAYQDHLLITLAKLCDYKIWSECSSSNHNWRNCQSLIKKCTNCSGDHKTMSSQCPRVIMIQQQQSEINRSVSSKPPFCSHPCYPRFKNFICQFC